MAVFCMACGRKKTQKSPNCIAAAKYADFCNFFANFQDFVKECAPESLENKMETAVLSCFQGSAKREQYNYNELV